ncbi:hypothetical protein ALC62_04642 [Cyphomyrmex costatus]|uniref:Uncharacterized protein n=1 Tax=Cyphomyrmex costatus TaxID=456900 RepID=A0A195CUQ9_9HYME|nr:hypothetical protein ALC62_04642 [Cyphomyrmex costatus]
MVESEQSNEKLMKKISEYDIKIAADKQSIQQLTCKIKELEEEQSGKVMEHNLEKSFFEDKIKELEHELKTLKKDDIQTVTKKGSKKKEKKIISIDFDTVTPNISTKSTSDIGINVSLCDIESNVKSKVQDKCIMTDEFYHTKNDPHPLFCAKCETHLPPELTPEKIYKAMITYPKLIEKDLPPSPKKIYSPPCSLPSTYPDFTNRNEDSLPKISPIPHLRSYSPCSDSISGNLKSQSERSSAITQICENIELRNTDTSHMPLVANLPNNFNSIPLSQNRNCAREHFHSDNLLIKHSMSIKKMKRKIRSLKSKMKTFQRLTEKVDTNSRCCVTNHKDDISLNSNLISLICKGMAKYFNEENGVCSKHERDNDSEKCTCCIQKIQLERRQQSNKCNAYESMYSKNEDLDEKDQVRNVCCDKTENAMKTTDILQFNHISKNILSSVHKNNLYSNINISSTSLNDIDETDKEEFLHKQNTLHSAEVAPVEHSLTMSRLDVDKLSNGILNKDVDTNYVGNETETGVMSLSNNKKILDHTDGKIVDINAQKNKIKRKAQIIHKDKSSEIYVNDNVGDRLLKNLRNLKRKKQPISRINKQDNIEPYSNRNSDCIELAKKPRIENEEEINNSSHTLNYIKNFKRNLDTQIESINKQIDDKLCSNHYEPTKKLRIAHTPKTPVHQLSINRDDSTHCMVRNIATFATLVNRQKNVNEQLNTHKDNLLIENKNPTTNKKCDEKNIVKSIETNSIDKRPVNEKDLDLTNAENSLQNNDITPSAINIQYVSKLAKCDDVSIENTINNSIRMNRVIGETLNNSDESNVHNDIVNDTANNLELEKPILLRTRIITRSVYKDLKHDKVNEALDRKEMSPTAELEYASEVFGDKNHNDHSIPKNAISNDKSSVLSDQSNVLEATRSENHNNSDISGGTIAVSHSSSQYCSPEGIGSHEIIGSPEGIRSPSPEDSGVIFENCINDNNMKESVNEMKNARNIQEETYVNNKVIKMQAIETQNRNLVMSQRDKRMELIFVPHNFEESQAPMSQLYKYIYKKKCTKNKLSRKEIEYACKITDKFVKKQLQRLMNSDWKDSTYEFIHDDIKAKLENTCGPRIIAKCIVEFIIEEVDHTEALDKSFTPPAPLMTKFEQKIITLLFDLEVSKPMVIYFVQAAIEFHMFRLNSDVKDPIDSLTRIYVVLSRIQKDREKIRMMCCSALYCMNLKSIAVLNTTLMCWSEVLPNAETNKEILSKCIAFLISSLQIGTDKERILKKLIHLKSLVSRCHNYTKETINDLVKELMTALKAKRIDGLNTAIILIAKREKAQWTYKNIIESVLLPMIINNQHPCIYSAFSLLGRLLRAFPLQDKDVHEISQQLCVLIESGQGSHDQQEGIISALLSLSRHKFDDISWPIIKWMPSKSLRPIVDTQLQTFLHTRTSNFWKEYLRKKNIKLIRSKA